MELEYWVARTGKARRAAHRALAKHESAASRAVILFEYLSKSLSRTPVDVQDYFCEAIACLEGELYRSAIVLAWAGYYHVFSRRFATRSMKPTLERLVQSGCLRTSWN
jgi:hypothetical protein